MSLRRLISLLAVTLLIPVLAACSTSGGASDPTPSTGEIVGAQPAGGINLDGTSWVLESGPFTGDVAASGITLEFAGGLASGSGGVNRYTGGFTSTPEGSLQFDAFAVTAMAGDPDAMALEQEYLTVLSQTFGYTADDTSLTLFGVADQVLTFTPAS